MKKMTKETSTDLDLSLWAGATIDIIGLTGDFESGKTLFGLTIDPDKTLMIDVEKSGSSYQDALGFDRIDLIEETRTEFGDNFQPIHLYQTFWRIVQEASDAYSVWLIDPISEIESGIAAYVTDHPEEFGFTAGQFRKMAGLKWGAVKELWKRILSVAADKCDTLVFTSHLKSEWKGDRPTKNQIPKGKETLMEVASLYLWLERPADEQGRKPIEPSARVLKSRLASSEMIDGKLCIAPTLPPRLPLATPDAIRHYVRNPPNYKKLKAGEKAPVAVMTDDDRLELQAEIAENQRITAETSAGAVASTDTFLGDHKPADASTPPWVEPGTHAAPVENLSPADLEREAATGGDGAPVAGSDSTEAEVQGDRCTPDQMRDLLDLKAALDISDKTWLHILSKRGVALVVDLSYDQASELLDNMKQAVN